MSLQLWYPFTQNIKNQGLFKGQIPSDQSSRLTSVVGGKIGNNYYKTGTQGVNPGSFNINIANTSSLSIAGWYKFNQSEIGTRVMAQSHDATYTTSNGGLLSYNAYVGFGLIWISNNIYTDNEFTALNIRAFIRTTTTAYKATNVYVPPFDKWVHLCEVFDRDKHTVKLYANGELVHTLTEIPAFSDMPSQNLTINHAGIAGGNGRSLNIPFAMNDIRAYDHALSDLEVKELAKGLAYHLSFDTSGIPINNKNLIINGFGDLGNDGWSIAPDTSNVPATPEGVVGSFVSSSHSNYVPLVYDHTYTISATIKAKGSGTAAVYPSLRCYDIDKKEIVRRMVEISSAYRTTLSQQLNPGDTVVHCTDLSDFVTTSGNYYNHLCIYGYTDGTGYTYPDYTYTQNCVTFWNNNTQTKTNIDKTNNTITLLAPYAGDPVPAGTAVAQSTDGATYFYPFGGLTVTSIADWTAKSATFSQKTTSDKMLRYAKFVRYREYNDRSYDAAIKIIDTTPYSTTPATISSIVANETGLGGDGDFRLGTSTNTACQSSTDTPRYTESSYFRGNLYRTTFKPVPGTEDFSVSMWVNRTAAGRNDSGTNQFASTRSTNLDKGFSVGFIPSSGKYHFTIRDGTTTAQALSSAFNDAFNRNTWHHFVFIRNSSDTNHMYMYIDGVRYNPDTPPSILNIVEVGDYIHIAHFPGGTNADRKTIGKFSDFRYYSTALSEDDVLALYKMGARIDNYGNIHDYDFSESATFNLVTGITRNGTTTLLDNGLGVVTSGADSDTWFCLDTYENILAGKDYTISCTASGLPDNGVWVFRLGNSSNASNTFNIRNGYNEYKFTASDINWNYMGVKKLLLDDVSGPRTSVCTFTNFRVYRNNDNKINITKPGIVNSGEFIEGFGNVQMFKEGGVVLNEIREV